MGLVRSKRFDGEEHNDGHYLVGFEAFGLKTDLEWQWLVLACGDFGQHLVVRMIGFWSVWAKDSYGGGDRW